MTAKKQSVTYAFIDATNIIYGAKRAGWKVDFEKLAGYLKKRYRVSKIMYYAGLNAESLDQLKFYEIIGGFGYELRLVPVKTFKDGKKKADVDSRMTFEMMLHLKKYDQAIVMTGDGDYYWVLEYIKQQKNKLVLASFPKGTAHELRELVGPDFANLNNLKSILEYRKKSK